MSLTGELSNNKSKVRIFFDSNFDFNDFIKETNKSINGAYTIYPKIRKDYPWSDVGHIVEYLMCLHVGLEFIELFPMKYARNEFPLFFKEKEKQYNKIGEYFKNKEKFRILINDLMKLSKIEGMFRSGVVIYHNELNKTCINDVILDDVIDIYFKSLKANSIINDKNNYFYYNPSFDLSAMVGGADADLYILRKNGNFLLDLKTTIKPELTHEMLFQLLGYVFLDSKDKHNLTSIGIYLTRQNLISEWSVYDLIKKYSNYQNVSEAKKSFYEMLISQITAYGYLNKR